MDINLLGVVANRISGQGGDYYGYGYCYGYGYGYGGEYGHSAEESIDDYQPLHKESIRNAA